MYSLFYETFFLDTKLNKVVNTFVINSVGHFKPLSYICFV